MTKTTYKTTYTFCPRSRSSSDGIQGSPMQVQTTLPGMKRAANYQAWALGSPQRNGFHVRRIVWGKLMAREERRPGEEIRKAAICVGPKHSR